jgi:biopolymer transport protein ExbD
MASVGGNQEDSVVVLNIMPMLDVFSILILFLLMNFSTDPLSHDMNKGVELPDSAILESLDEVPTITISRTELLVNDLMIASVSNGKISDNLRSQGGIVPLYEELQKMAEANRRFANDQTKANILTLEVDKNQKFDLIKSVMLSAQQAGFIRFKLMVLKQI